MGFCDRCGAEIVAPNVDRERGIATCPRCGSTRDLRLRGKEPSDRQSGRKSQVPAGVIVGLLLLLIVPGAIALLVHSFTSEIEGSLTFRGELGSKTFKPDECSSGQVNGFAGVELRSSASQRRVRLILDELGQPKVAILEAGRKPTVLTAEQCKRLELSVVRTGTSTNDVSLMEGEASIECPSLTGELTYARCGL